jgi:hypothetical protein
MDSGRTLRSFLAVRKRTLNDGQQVMDFIVLAVFYTQHVCVYVYICIDKAEGSGKRTTFIKEDT